MATMTAIDMATTITLSDTVHITAIQITIAMLMAKAIGIGPQSEHIRHRIVTERDQIGGGPIGGNTAIRTMVRLLISMVISMSMSTDDRTRFIIQIQRAQSTPNRERRCRRETAVRNTVRTEAATGTAARTGGRRRFIIRTIIGMDTIDMTGSNVIGTGTEMDSAAMIMAITTKQAQLSTTAITRMDTERLRPDPLRVQSNTLNLGKHGDECTRTLIPCTGSNGLTLFILKYLYFHFFVFVAGSGRGLLT